jgi:sugar phosphate isomerase/epimerase
MKISLSDYNADWAYIEHYQHPRSFRGSLTPQDVIRYYATLNVDAVEYTHAYWGHIDAAEARTVASDHGLAISCYVFPADLVQPRETLQREIDQAKANLDRTAALGAPFAMITPGVVKPGVSLAEQESWMVAGLRLCAEHAVKVGVTACIENLDYPPGRPLSGAPAQCQRICTRVDSPGLRLIYDCGATLFVDTPALEALETMSPSMVHVHLKNSRRVAEGENPQRFLDSDAGIRYTGCLLNEGAVDIPAVVAELVKAQYRGYLLIEYQGESDPRSASDSNVRYLRDLLN